MEIEKVERAAAFLHANPRLIAAVHCFHKGRRVFAFSKMPAATKTGHF
jgi:hypothetical protein